MMKVPHVKFKNTYIELRLEGLTHVDANGHSFHFMKERGEWKGPRTNIFVLENFTKTVK
jgi:hypothetical protein